jgi:hypothetical protein
VGIRDCVLHQLGNFLGRCRGKHCGHGAHSFAAWLDGNARLRDCLSCYDGCFHFLFLTLVVPRSCTNNLNARCCLAALLLAQKPKEQLHEPCQTLRLVVKHSFSQRSSCSKRNAWASKLDKSIIRPSTWCRGLSVYWCYSIAKQTAKVFALVLVQNTPCF